MPKQKRWHFKKQLDQADLACDKAQKYIVGIGYEFQQHHPEYFEAFSAIVQMLELIRIAIQQLRDEL